MFRRRIYAQGFTILAMIAGSAYWEGDRAKRQQYDGLVEEKQKKERHEAWLRELEVRDEEEKELRALRSKLMKGRTAEKQDFTEGERRMLEEKARRDSGQDEGSIRSVLERSEARGTGGVLKAARELWEKRR
jgi:hypothetical protein